MVYPNKELNSEELTILLSIKKDDITLDKLKELFAFKQNSNPLFNPNDTFTLKKNLVYNDKDEKTTVGRYIFNKFILDDKIGPLIKYMNYPMDGGAIGGFNGKLSNFL